MITPTPTCLNCTSPADTARGRGLCRRCYYTPEVRDRFPKKPPSKRIKTGPYTCKHCSGPSTRKDRRGLCSTCYFNLRIRNQYPVSRGYSDLWHEPTEEELETVIAEQMKCLPDWWDRSYPHDHETSLTRALMEFEIVRTDDDRPPR